MTGAVCNASTLRTRDADLCFATSLFKNTDVTYTVSNRQRLFRIGLHLPCFEVDPLIDIMDILDISTVRERERLGVKRETARERERRKKNDQAF